MKNPCKNCTERRAGCHSDCKKHKDWKDDQQKRKEYLEKMNYNPVAQDGLRYLDKVGKGNGKYKILFKGGKR